MGLSLASQAPCDSVTAVFVPDGLADPVRAWCKAQRQVVFAGGQDEWKGRVIRMSHMGNVGVDETIAGIEAIAGALDALAPGRFDTAAGARSVRDALTKEAVG